MRQLDRAGLEAVARQIHHIWSVLVVDLLEQCTLDHSGAAWISEAALADWTQKATSVYEALPEDEKEKRRVLAAAVINILGGRLG